MHFGAVLRRMLIGFVALILAGCAPFLRPPVFPPFHKMAQQESADSSSSREPESQIKFATCNNFKSTFPLFVGDNSMLPSCQLYIAADNKLFAANNAANGPSKGSGFPMASDHQYSLSELNSRISVHKHACLAQRSAAELEDFFREKAESYGNVADALQRLSEILAIWAGYRLAFQSNLSVAAKTGTAALVAHTLKPLIGSEAHQVIYLAAAENISCLRAANRVISLTADNICSEQLTLDGLRQSLLDYGKTADALLREEEKKSTKLCRTVTSSTSKIYTQAKGVGLALASVGKPPSIQRVCPKRPVHDAFDDTAADITQAEQLIDKISKLFSEIDRHTGQLKAESEQIAYRVGSEVAKADTSDVSTIFSLMTLPKQLPITATAQAGKYKDPKAKRSVSLELEPHFQQLRTAILRAETLRATLQERVHGAGEAYQACLLKRRQGSLQVTPHEELYQLNRKDAITFRAHAEDGSPQFHMVGLGVDKIEVKKNVDRSDLEVSLSLKKEANSTSKSRVQVTVSFSNADNTLHSRPTQVIFD